MKAQEQPLRANLEVEAEDAFGYHQDSQDSRWMKLGRAESFVPIALITIILLYHVLSNLGHNLLPLQQLLWNILVYVTPYMLLDTLESYTGTSTASDPKLRPRTHAAKSAVMRRVLGLDLPDGIINKVAQVGRGRSAGFALGELTQQVGRPPGLGNWDNSCYQNSVLQGLASLETLPGYLSGPGLDPASTAGPESSQTKTTKALKKLIATLNDPSNRDRRLWTPAALKSMSSWQQQDAQEYFSKILDEIDKEMEAAYRTITAPDGLCKTEHFSSLETSSSSDLQASPTRRNPLEGLIAQRVGCTICGHSEGLSMIPFNCLTVPLGKAWEYHLSDCLDEYTKLEQIEGVECAKCTLLKHQRLLSAILDRVKDGPESGRLRGHTTQRLNAVNLAVEYDDFEDKTLINRCGIPARSRVTSTKSRQAVIARAPRSLVVHVNRSLFDEVTGDLSKNYSGVHFPRFLDLGPWCLGSAQTSKDIRSEEWDLDPDVTMVASSGRPSRQRGPLYKLRALITHYGRHENGHYTCYKCTKLGSSENADLEEQWWSLSDDDVVQVTEEQMMSQGSVFMLFYDCIQTIPFEIPGANDGSTDEGADHYVLEDEASSELALAASISLPPADDLDLSESDKASILTTRVDSIATSVSEADENEATKSKQEVYRPAKPIIIPHYLASSSKHIESGGAEQKRHIPNSMLMV